MKQTFFARHALLILMVVFFFVPFALRGARQALQGMKNDVRDWLPASYDETGELLWFKEHFLGEQFVVISWEGLHGDENDQNFSLFLNKLLPSIPPSAVREQLLAAMPAVAPSSSDHEEADNSARQPTHPLFKAILTQAEVDIEQPDFLGDDLGLYTLMGQNHEPEFYLNWGGLNEKWLKGSGNQWYYITPDGSLYRWNGVDAPIAALGRWIWRNVVGEQLTGELVKSFGELDGPWYYENPRRLRAQLFKTVSTGPGVYQSLIDNEHGVLRHAVDGDEEIDAAKERLIGTLFGPDGKQTCIVVTLTDAAKRDLHQVLGRGWLGKPYGRLYEIGGESNIAEPELRIGGPPVDNVAIDEEGTITLVRLVGLSVMLGLGLSYVCFRSISATIMVFFVGAVSAVCSVALVWWLGSSMDAILMSMPSLVYVLGLSSSVHLMNYYYQAIEEGGLPGAAERAVAHAWKPALLCNVTTAIGLLSLYTSEIVPIRKFGTFAAIGVTAMVIVVFTYLPAVLQIWPQKPRVKRQIVDGEEVPWLDKYLSGFWQMLGGAIIRNHAAVAIGCTLLIAFVGYGVTRIQTSVNLLKMFDSSAKIIADYQWLEEHLGRLVPMEVVIKVGKDSHLATATERAESDSQTGPAKLSPATAKSRAIDDLVRLNFLGRLEIASRVEQAIEDKFGADGQDMVGNALSACTFAPDPPPADYSFQAYLDRLGTNKKLEANRNKFLASDYLREDKKDGGELWRISVRLAASQKVDYGGFVKDLKTVVEPVLQAYRDRETVIRDVAEVRLAKNVAAGKGDDITKAVNPIGAAVLVLGGPDRPASGSKVEVDSELLRKLTLIDLLLIARMKVEERPGNLNDAKLARYDAVVVAGELTSAERSLMARSVTKVIDVTATSHSRSPSVTSVSAVYTGVVPIVYKAQQALLASLIDSTKWSFLTITPLMMFVARSWRAGAVAMLPNALPVLVVFGAMGWLNIEVDVGSMMTASIALGVAVDDTIHYLTWFREELARCSDRKVAILRTYQRCATPTFQAALISGLGLSIFAFSTFTPTQRFGYLMLTILWAGVAAELIYFPALLAGPLGSVFTPAKRHPRSEDATESPPAPHQLEEPVTAGAIKSPLVKPHLVRRDGPHKAVQ